MKTVYAKVAQEVGNLQNGYLRRDSSAVRTMAALRQGVSQLPGSDPAIWDLTIEDLQEEYRPRDSPSREEWATHIALTHFALHQQSLTQGMHAPERGFGEAMRLLISSGKFSEAGVRRRLNAFLTASSPAEMKHHLGALVRMLRTARVGLDYARFARELTFFLNPNTRQQTQLRWAREFSKTTKTDSTTDQEN